MKANSTPDCDQIRPLLEAYALDALAHNEQRLVAQHLDACPGCRELAREYADIAVGLSEAVAGVSPHIVPDRLKETVMSEIVRLTETKPAHQQQRASSPIDLPTTTSAKSSDGLSHGNAAHGNAIHSSSTSSSGWDFGHRWSRMAFALATLLLALSLLWSIRLNVILARERARLSEYANLVDQQEIVLEVIDSENAVRRVLLPVGDFPSRPYGKVFTRTDMNHVVAMAARLPEVPAGEAYHLWLTRGEETELAGLMNVNDEGFGLLVFDEDVNDPLYDAAQLTRQPIDSDLPAEIPTESIIIRWDATP